MASNENENKQSPTESKDAINNNINNETDSQKLCEVNGDKIETGMDSEKSEYDGANASNAIVAPDEALKNVLAFAKENHLKYKRNNTYCKVCDCKISSSLKRLKEHVQEQSHKDKAAGVPKVVIPKVPLTDFIMVKTDVENFFVREVVINDKFCLSIGSFETLSINGAKIRCQTCEVSMNHHEVDRHIHMWQHERGKQTASVLVAFDTEFVREVRPGLYHCGFCNFIEGSMKDLKNHLKSVNHISKKGFARNRLINHMPDIIQHRQMEGVRQLILGGMRNLFV